MCDLNTRLLHYNQLYAQKQQVQLICVHFSRSINHDWPYLHQGLFTG